MAAPPIPVIDAATLRTNFPEFASTTNYPDPVINFYLGLAYLLLAPAIWNAALPYGVQLFVAHNLVLEFTAQTAAGKGQPPGGQVGMLSGKSAGPLSINWDTGSAAELNAGHWNETTYGQRYIRLARQLATVGIQLGIGCVPQGPGFGPAWPGPPPWPASYFFSS